MFFSGTQAGLIQLVLPLQLNLRFASNEGTNETQPGKDVVLHVDTDPESHVWLLAMDQAMILYGGNENDLTYRDVSAGGMRT